MDENNDMNNVDNDEIVIDLREILSILKKQLSMIIGITAAFVACAVIYCLMIAKPVYESTALLKAGMNNKEFFTSRAVLEPIMEKYGEKDSKGKLIRFDEFAKKVKVSQAQRSQFLKVAVEGKSPEIAQKINEMVVDGAYQKIYDLEYKRIDLNIEYAEKELVKAGEELAQAEKDMKLARSRTDSMSYDVAFSKMNSARSRQLAVQHKIDNLHLQRDNVQNKIEIVDKPSYDDRPVKPKKAMICAVALLLGVIVGCAAAIGKEKL